MSVNLDELYGIIRSPYLDVTETEKSFQPQSLTVLDEDTARRLKNYLGASADIGPAETINRFNPLLWLVRINGDLVIAAEEVVDPSNGEVCNLYNRALNNREDKLGHPSLTEDPEFRARIAGEIRLEDGEWTISTLSGRYCRAISTKKEHLQNVVELFAHYGIVLIPLFRAR
nr:MAG TPA: hypothetical protein [Caudoviricetes sp.]